MEKKGLSKKEVEERITHGDVNGNCDIATKTYKEIVKEHVFTYFNFLNISLAVCVAFVHSYRNMLFLGVVFWNALIGIIQGVRAKKVIDKMNILMESKVKVWRDGEQVLLSTKEVVKDDLVIFESGEQVCADVKVVEGMCEVDESMLTGESDPVAKYPGDTMLSGSHLTSGTVEARVYAVGENNYANTIVKAAKAHKKTKSEIKDSIDKIIKVISMVVLPLGILMFFKQWMVLDLSLKDAVVKTVASMVSMIPDGLVLLASGVMAISIVKLSKENAIVEELFSIESLARVDVLCLDKTGTITEGRMNLEAVISADNGEFEQPLREYVGAARDENATMQAIKKKYEESTVWDVQEVIPFSSKRKWGAIAFDNNENYILGAPEILLGREYELYKERLGNYIEQGRRIVVFGKEEEKIDRESLPEHIMPLAFLVLEDCIRKNAKETLEYFQKQGVSLKLISGDNVDTVMQIAKRAGLSGFHKGIDARTIDSREALEEAAEKYTIFGRTSPEQKKELVQALQRKGHIVGMTGDGVNDVLALKEADCSIVMDSGCDVARKTAKVVLVGSDFSAIPKVLEEGRRAINNLERSATLFLNKTTLAVLILFVFLFLNVAYPLQPIQFTLINAITIGIPAFLLALEPNYDLVTGQFFKKVCKTAVPAGFLSVLNMAIIIGVSKYFSYSETLISTLAVLGVVIANFFLLLYICKPWNRKRMILIGGLIGLFCFLAYWGAEWFMFTRLSMSAKILIAAVAGMDMILYTKVLVRKKGC
ncbi:MAG: HAD-IC family P-type ATPase [Lachnospiraceae bacterium]|nr:HAD-IC family P-type ATPase [Lachnospiraceae bacterium]